jgi:hypothetical protein
VAVARYRFVIKRGRIDHNEVAGQRQADDGFMSKFGPTTAQKD